MVKRKITASRLWLWILLIFFVLNIFSLVSCRTEPDRHILDQLEQAREERVRQFIILDYKNRALGGGIPGWVELWLGSGNQGVENLGTFRNCFVFVSRNEGSNFNALNLWNEGFDVNLDFPRLATARIDARFSYSVSNPDEEFGAFYFNLLREAANAAWTGAIREDDFWILKSFFYGEDEEPRERWVFFVLVTMERNLFSSQLDSIFQRINPTPPPSRAQISAVNQVKGRFFEGF